MNALRPRAAAIAVMFLIGTAHASPPPKAA